VATFSAKALPDKANSAAPPMNVLAPAPSTASQQGKTVIEHGASIYWRSPPKKAEEPIHMATSQQFALAARFWLWRDKKFSVKIRGKWLCARGA